MYLQERERGQGMKHLTPRGWVVLVVIPSFLLIWGLVEVSTHLWWTQEGYCWGQYLECYKGGM
jgi:hypothetical protein